jgi:2-polyprenyl-6-methoxyphenol hydroxylase-like FAD-dependent oxidoreductase
MLEQLFPGLAEQMMVKGAVPMIRKTDTALFLSGAWRNPPESFVAAIAGCSRPLLETTLCQRLAALPQIRIIQEYEVGGLAVDGRGRLVTGVHIHHRHNIWEGESILPADLVVDASGRYSHAPHWLQALGYPPPLDTIVDALSGYASRIYQRPANFVGEWQAMYIRPAPQVSSRGGIILPLEDERWQVTLIGMANDHPPTDEEGFLAFAHTLPTDRLYEAIKDAQPLTSVHGYRLTANRLRGYDRLPRYLEGFVALGDAVHTMNPVYAQGVTLAAGDSLVLDRVLEAHCSQQGAGDLKGLASTFQKELRKELTSSWRLGTREDRRWPTTKEIREAPSVEHY